MSVTRSRLLTCVVSALVTVLVAGTAAAVVLHRTGEPERFAGAAAPASPASSWERHLTSLPTTSTGTSTGSRRVHVFPVAHCATSYARAHHDYPAADVFAARGCLFVSPVDGRVDEVNRIDRWRPRTNRGADRGGLMVSIVGVDGVRYYGAHLERVLRGVHPGLVVKAGAPLGRVGDTGSARGVGTHLHFGLSWPTPVGYWWIRRGAVAPAGFLDAWRAGRRSSPVAAMRAARAAYGDDSRCHAYC